MRLLKCVTPLLFAVALLGHGTPGQAQVVTLRCGGGTVPTAGFVINNLGEVVFSEESIACNVTQTGLPDPLILAITSPLPGTSINVSSSAQVVPFSGLITNFTGGVDSCQVQVQPPSPSNPWAPVNLVPNGAGVVSTNINFAKGLPGGTYTLQLSCTRVVNGQQVVVPATSRSITVINQGGGEPDECLSEPIPDIFAPVVQVPFTAQHFAPFMCTSPGTGGFGGQPNASICARYFENSNKLTNNEFTQIGLKTFKFRPTTNSRVKLTWGNASSNGVALSISQCPGKYSGLPAACTSTGSLTWSTRQGESWCQLDPTKDYYINYAHFDLPTFLDTGDFEPVRSCAGTNCVVNEIWKVQNTPAN